MAGDKAILTDYQKKNVSVTSRPFLIGSYGHPCRLYIRGRGEVRGGVEVESYGGYERRERRLSSFLTMPKIKEK
jgi:hypothetical protein